MKLLIDGENFRHQIAHVLVVNKKIKVKNDHFPFDFTGFCKEVLKNEKLEIVYYSTRIKQPRYKIPVMLSTQITKISNANRKWIAQLTNAGVKVIKAGHLRVRESNTCIHCGKKTLVLQEKGVDVRVATDLVLLAAAKERTVSLASSDSDLAPSLEAAKRLGLEITYLCHAEQLNRSVATHAKRVITFDDALVLKYFGKSK